MVPADWIATRVRAPVEPATELSFAPGAVKRQEPEFVPDRRPGLSPQPGALTEREPGFAPDPMSARGLAPRALAEQESGLGPRPEPGVAPALAAEPPSFPLQIEAEGCKSFRFDVSCQCLPSRTMLHPGESFSLPCAFQRPCMRLAAVRPGLHIRGIVRLPGTRSRPMAARSSLTRCLTPLDPAGCGSFHRRDSLGPNPRAVPEPTNAPRNRSSGLVTIRNCLANRNTTNRVSGASLLGNQILIRSLKPG